jgi:hypothetical protein
VAALRELFAAFTIDFDKAGSLAKGAATVDGLWAKLQGFGKALAGGAIVGGVIGLTKHVIEMGDELATQADRLGIAAESLQSWHYAADLADVSTEEFNGSLRFLQKNLQDAKSGGKETAGAFKALGVSAADLKDLGTEDALVNIAEGMAKIDDPAKRTALAMKLLGRGGQALVPLLSKGAAGIEELRAEYQALGAGLNEETIQAANDADDAFKRLGYGVKGLIYNAVKPFILFATKMATTLKDGLVWFRELSKNSNVVSGALIVLGATAAVVASQILIAFLPLILTTLAWAAGIAAAVLIVDDLITTVPRRQVCDRRVDRRDLWRRRGKPVGRDDQRVLGEFASCPVERIRDPPALDPHTENRGRNVREGGQRDCVRRGPVPKPVAVQRGVRPDRPRHWGQVGPF